MLRAAVASKFLHLVIVTAESKDPYQGSASIVYVKEQMGHGSIQVTVDTYGHLIPGANVSFVDRSDEIPTDEPKTSRQQSATPRSNVKWRFRRTSSKLLKVLVAAVGLEPTTYGL